MNPIIVRMVGCDAAWMSVLQNNSLLKSINNGLFVIMEHLHKLLLQSFQKDLNLLKAVGSKKTKKRFTYLPLLSMRVIQDIQKFESTKANIFN
jgi:hypothetical protein